MDQRSEVDKYVCCGRLALTKWGIVQFDSFIEWIFIPRYFMPIIGAATLKLYTGPSWITVFRYKEVNFNTKLLLVTENGLEGSPLF